MNPFEMPSIEGKPPDPLRAGMKLFGDRYELVRPLGAGGMGVVWLAKNLVENSLCALKFLLQVFVQDAREMDKLREQVKRGKELHHARLVATYGLEADGPYAAIVMEYVEGVTLRHKLETSKKGFFEPDEISAWVHDLCEGLDYIHKEAGWAHRDIKPANIMLDTDGRVRLMDFGISQRIAQTMTRLSRVEEKPDSESSGCTLAYASPQQVASKPARPADDIYSVGALLYELLSGRPPFLGAGVDLLTAQILNTMPPPIKERRIELAEDYVTADSGGDIPVTWEAAVAKCLSKDPAERPENASLLWEWLQHGEVEVEVEEIHTEAPTVAATAPPSEPAKPPSPTLQKKDGPVRSNLTPVWLPLTVVLLGAGWLFGYELPKRKSPAAEPETPYAKPSQKPSNPEPNQAEGSRSLTTTPPKEQQTPAAAKADASSGDGGSANVVSVPETPYAKPPQKPSDLEPNQVEEPESLTTTPPKEQQTPAAAKADASSGNGGSANVVRVPETPYAKPPQKPSDLEPNQVEEPESLTTTPPKEQQATDIRKASLSAFMQSHIDSYLSDDPDVFAGMFALSSQNKYYNKEVGPGAAPRSWISKDRSKYLKDYPYRTIQLLNGGNYSYEMRGESKADVSYSYSYRVRGMKTKSGQSHVDITIEYIDSEWQITKFEENVIRN
jgi:serine/threonine protein kinase